MNEREWYRLDNASNIFLATQNEIDTKVFRLSAEMTEKVEPELLQMALNTTYEEYTLFHSTLRRGYFWYYLESSEVNPRVKFETDPPVSPIYQSGRRNFLFRVLYRENRIHLEVFHALTDGTGALWFFEDLLTEYVKLKNLENEEHPALKIKREKENLEDSFNRYFKKENSLVLDQLASPFKLFFSSEEDDSDMKFFPRPLEQQIDEKVYQIKGTKTADHRPRIINLDLPLKKTLELARAENVSLTIYLTALYVLSVYMTSKEQRKETTISVSIPINLRQFFPSVTVRNFFSTTKVAYTFKKTEEPSLSKICQELDQQFQKKLEKEALENRLRKLIDYEYNPAARIILRPIKDLVLKVINQLNNRKITGAMSNLGRVDLPKQISPYVKDFNFYTSVIRPQFCMISYQNQLNVTFTSPYTETNIVQWFVRYLTQKGLEVSIDVNKVTREELQEL